MEIIKSITKFFRPENKNIFYMFEMNGTEVTEIMNGYLWVDLIREIRDKLSKKYVDDFGDEILKSIQEKTIESKVIQKVIENLKKELKSNFERKED